MNRICLVHYHEIGLKGKNRSFFEKKLESNIKKSLELNGFKDFSLRRISGRILIEHDGDSESILNLVKNIPGCARTSAGYKCDQTIDAMIEAGCEVMRNFSEGRLPESFKVSARRNHTNFEKDSMEINQLVGGSISDAFPEVKVQMKDPELDIRVEVIEGGAYVYGDSVVGVGGLPVGTGGKVVAMLSSGIDSPVSL
ncbi:MAG: THUMP domain-containing protein [Coriobacteriia bacterium]|nr:THUMP domain-containing protein [Coriobacteriia bacterium]